MTIDRIGGNSSRRGASRIIPLPVTRLVAAAVWDRSDLATVDQSESVTVAVVSAAAVREVSVSVAGYSWLITLQTSHRPTLLANDYVGRSYRTVPKPPEPRNV
jgi:hypothetical protein